MNALLLAMAFKGSPLAILLLLSEVIGVMLTWKAILAFMDATSRLELLLKDPSLPTFSEFHEQWKKDQPDE